MQFHQQFGAILLLCLICFWFPHLLTLTPAQSICYFEKNDAPHCIGYESGETPEGFSIPCGRGDGGENPILYLVTGSVGYGLVLIITPTVIVGTMLLMYKSVSKIEQRMQNYGVHALRLNARSGGGGNRGESAETNSTRRSANDQQGIMSRIKRSVLMCCMIPRCLHRRDDQAPTSRSNRSTSQKRAILDLRSHGFSFLYLFLRLIFCIGLMLH